MSDFIPPKPNKALIRLAEFMLPFYLNFVEHLSFKFSHTQDRPANFLKGKNVVIVINHSDRQDPLLLVALGKHMHQEFYCIAARESFDWGYGILGWMFQRFGCFSVDRGTTDFKSIHTTKSILTDSSKTLIVFPEGEVTGDDHTVHEINPALMHVFLNAQKKIAHDQSSQSLWVLPIGVSYRLLTDLHSSVDKTLTQVEERLEIKRTRRVDPAARAINAVDTLLKNYSTKYEFELRNEKPRHEQVRLLARHVCQRIADVLNVDYDDELPTEQLLYCLRSKIPKKISVKDCETLLAEKQEPCNENTDELDAENQDASKSECGKQAADAEGTQVAAPVTCAAKNNNEETVNQNLEQHASDESETTSIEKQQVLSLEKPSPAGTMELHAEWSNDLDRAERLLILQRVLNQRLSPIQVCRIADFLESELFGRMTAKGKQRASVFFGNPIEVLPFLTDYESDKTSAVEKLRAAVRSGLQSALDNSRQKLRPRSKSAKRASLEKTTSNAAML